jgi:uncharacterized membrane protein YcaP (DUF421 family)
MSTIIYAATGYFFLLLIIRVLQRRPGAQMTMAEFVLVFLLGGVIILATVGKDRSVTNCTCGVITVALMHRMISYLKVRYPRLGVLVDGTPLVLVRKGEVQEHVVRRMNMAEEDLMAAARLNDLRSMDEIDYAVLERDGGISVIKRKEQSGG